MNPIITLTTDFGTQDGYIGAMKGRILSICPQVTLVDITHEIAPQAVESASWSLMRSTPHFPVETIHLAVIDPGVGSSRSPVLLKANQQWYIGPNNGVFSQIAHHFKTDAVYRIHTKSDLWKSHQSFDGLALFAPVAAHLAAGISLEKIGRLTDELKIFPQSQAVHSDNTVTGAIIAFDHFGNAITNIGNKMLHSFNKEKTSIRCSNQLFIWVYNYQEGQDHEPVALINSDNCLELSFFKSSAQKELKLNIGDKVIVKQK